MCCFSGTVEQVDSTRIFARLSAPGRQVLAYQMKVKAPAPVAMILPVPGGDLRFISLEGYRDFFEDVQRAFPAPAGLLLHDSMGGELSLSRQLEVHDVGDFVASFVPTLADFSRLDPRFRLPAATLHGYEDFAFAVFQLKATRSAVEAHPMAFEFSTRLPQLFFPTLHVHDGTRHQTAQFAHDLYAQGVTGDWRSLPLGKTVDVTRAQGLVDPDQPAFHRSLYGVLPNEDVLWAR